MPPICGKHTEALAADTGPQKALAVTASDPAGRETQHRRHRRAHTGPHLRPGAGCSSCGGQVSPVGPRSPPPLLLEPRPWGTASGLCPLCQHAVPEPTPVLSLGHVGSPPAGRGVWSRCVERAVPGRQAALLEAFRPLGEDVRVPTEGQRGRAGPAEHLGAWRIGMDLREPPRRMSHWKRDSGDAGSAPGGRT